MDSGKVIGFVGLDELGLKMASSLVRHGYAVQAFEISDPIIKEFVKLGGIRCASPLEAGKGAEALVVLISHTDQINDLIFGDEGALKGLKPDTVLILRSTILPSALHKLEKDLEETQKIAYVVDAYASFGRSDALNGKVIIVSSGRSDSIARVRSLLSAMCEKLFTFEGEIGGGSKVKMVSVMLEGIHFIASVEALSLGAKAGIHPWIIYDIISNAAGNSWVFKNNVPLLLKGEVKHHILNTLVKELETILDMAKSLTFPLPLLATTHQQLIHGVSQVCYEDDDDTTLIKIWEKVYGVKVSDAANADVYNPEQLASQVTTASKSGKRVGFVGLGAMGFGMATHLLGSNFSVFGYDVYEPTRVRFSDAGGVVGKSPAEVSKDVDVLIIMVANEVQAENALYGEYGAVSVLPPGATIILSSTVSPAYVSQLERRLHNGDKNLNLVDAPVSGGVQRASLGTLTIMASGTDDALKSVGNVLAALSEKLYVIRGGCGSGSGIKMVNQLLAGVHIASAAEAMAFAARLGLNTRLLFDFITISGGTSWMFENRVPHMLNNDYTPYSALDIFVKDMGIVTRESSSLKVPLQLSTIVHQLYLSGSAAGFGRKDDAGVVKVYETLTGVRVEGKLESLRKDVVLHSLPPEWPQDHVLDIQKLKESNSKILVVLDDDPTGTQTVHDIEVLTEWTVDSLIDQFRRCPKCFFILTNSRALSSDKATILIKEICRNLNTAANSVDNIDYTVVLRGDSTLRGHFPEETDAVISVLGEMDAWIICPFFLQGGRYTINDTHYVADSDILVPAGDTEFAKDAAFGYKSSNLRDWVEEKTNGRILANSVVSISIQILRKGGPDAVFQLLCSLKKGSVCIVNAASERDMTVFALGMIKAELSGKRFLCRTAASFVSARIGIISKPPVLPKDLGIARERNGGLIIVGSYVPKTTKQVEQLKLQCAQFLRSIEVSVEKLALGTIEEREDEISRAAELADVYLRTHKDTLIMTSRNLITGKSASESLDINYKVSSALVEIMKRITTKPRYIIAKGGITSSDLATKALGARCAKIVGQALAGIPLWQLGPESRHPGVPYIVFPGNVGDSGALAEVVKSWTYPTRLSSTKEILNNAENGGYAVGAFNVYNLEGVDAVVSAAEEEQSPAILQIHPGALKQGGIPLVACCISAAERASVPITVHFDHGTSKQDLVEALELGFSSVMVDGSHLSFNENAAYTKFISLLAHSNDMLVEAELGRLSGTEDDLTVEEYEAKLTDVNMAEKFIDETGIDALAVCIGNVHGKYPASGPNLRLDLLKELHVLSQKKGVFLVLHGASGLGEELVKECINLGVRKFNVNTEVRKAYMDSLITPKKDLVHVMASAKEAMKAVVAEKMHLFGSAGKA
ncbi:ketose-bisphosphate aldolase class-II family protein [Trifolium repens]|nr:ketose-bisphosphate aldolase class-II family protein [Trifolium repens]